MSLVERFDFDIRDFVLRLLSRPESECRLELLAKEGRVGYLTAIQLITASLQLQIVQTASSRIISDRGEVIATPDLGLAIVNAQNRYDALNRYTSENEFNIDFAKGFDFGHKTVSYCLKMLKAKGVRVLDPVDQLRVLKHLEDPQVRMQITLQTEHELVVKSEQNKHAEKNNDKQPNFDNKTYLEFLETLLEYFPKLSGTERRDFLNNYRGKITARLYSEGRSVQEILEFLEQLNVNFFTPKVRGD